MPVRSAASRKGRWVPGRKVCAPWRSTCTSRAARINTCASSLMCSTPFGLLPRFWRFSGWLCLAFRRRKMPGLSTLGRSRRLAAARSSLRWRRIPSSISPSVSPSDLLSGSPRRSRVSSCVSSPMAKYASCSRAHASQKGIPRISTTAWWGHGLCVLLRTWQAPSCVTASIKRTSLLRIRNPLLVVGAPPVSAPTTDRARALRKDIPTLKTGITAVRQAYDGGPVGPRCRLLRFLLGGEGLGLHHYSLRWGWLPHQCQAATLSSILYIILQLY